MDQFYGQDAKEVVVTGGTGAGEVSDLRVRFVRPGEGRFGRDATVPLAEATAAKVSYLKDGRLFEADQMSVTEARQLIELAMAHQRSAAERDQARRAQEQAELAEAERRVADLSCLVCGGREFDEQMSREDSQWGFSTFRMRLLICQRCGFVMQFSLGRSLFVPGS